MLRCADHDLSSPLGVVMGMIAALALSAGSTVHCGTVCTSFCWINSGTHQRTAALPLGQTDFEYVALGNMLAAVTVPCLQAGIWTCLPAVLSTSRTMGLLGPSFIAKLWLRNSFPRLPTCGWLGFEAACQPWSNQKAGIHYLGSMQQTMMFGNWASLKNEVWFEFFRLHPRVGHSFLERQLLSFCCVLQFD